MPTKRPILCLDFDGVIHSYESGWKGAAVVPDPPTKGAIDFLRRAVNVFDVHIFSSRSNQPGGLTAMQQWLGYWVAEQRESDHEDLAWASDIKWPLEKPPALVTVDDRAVTFTGEWPTLSALMDFKPWNKLGEPGESKPYDMSIHSNPDAQAWAALFAKTFPLCNVDEATMHTWFANAMEAMRTHLDQPQ